MKEYSKQPHDDRDVQEEYVLYELGDAEPHTDQETQREDGSLGLSVTVKQRICLGKLFNNWR